MPNHVHLIAIPQDETGFARAVGKALRCYTRRINFREQWRGHLWQERFASFPMDEQHLPAAACHIDFLRLSTEDELKVLQLHERTGRPLGSAGFVEKMEQSFGENFTSSKTRPQKEKEEELNILSPDSFLGNFKNIKEFIRIILSRKSKICLPRFFPVAYIFFAANLTFDIFLQKSYNIHIDTPKGECYADDYFQQIPSSHP